MDNGKLMIIKEMSQNLINVATRILNGEDSLVVCQEENINHNWFCKLIHVKWDYINGKIALLKQNESILWKEKFIHDLYGDSHVPLEDFDQAFELTMQFLSPREERIIYMYYVDGKSLRKIGSEFGVTGQTINNIRKKAIQKLQTPLRSKYFLYGVDNIQKLEEANESLRYIKEQFNISVKKRLIYQECFHQIDKEYSNISFKKCKSNTMSSIRDYPIKNLKLSVRSMNVLYRTNILTLDTLLSKNYDDLMNVRNLGRINTNEVINVIRNMGFYDWPNRTYEIKQNTDPTPLSQLLLSSSVNDYLSKNQIDSIEKLENLYLEDLINLEELDIDDIVQIIIKMKVFGYHWWPLENTDNLNYK